MDNFNLNKIATSFLFASLIILLISNVIDMLYDAKKAHNTHRGYEIAVEDHMDTPTSQNTQDTLQPLDIKSLMLTADPNRGKSVSKKCTSCHTFEKGGGNRVGPNLWNIVGNNKAHLGSNFNYSSALLAKGGKWEYEDLFSFLTKPQSYIKGTRMSFAGLQKASDIADLIAYIESLV